MFDIEKNITAEWFNWQQPAKPLYLGGCFEAVGEQFQNQFGIKFFTSLLYFRLAKNDKSTMLGSWILRHNEGRECGADLVNLLRHKSFQSTVAEAFEHCCSSLLVNSNQVLSEIETDIISKNSHALEKFVDSFIQFYSIGCITEPIQWRIEQILFSNETGEFLFDKEGKLGEQWTVERIRDAVFVTNEEPYINKIEESLGKIEDKIYQNKAESIKKWLDLRSNVSIDALDRFPRESATMIDDGISSRENEFNKIAYERQHQQIELLDQDLISMLLRDRRIKNLIEAHIKKYYWRRNNYECAIMLNFEQVVHEVIDNIVENQNLDQKKLISVNKKRKQSIGDRDELIQTLGEPFTTFCKIGDEFGTGMADRRKRVMLEAMHSFDAIAGFLAQKNGISKQLMENILPKELFEFSKNPNPYIPILEKRNEGLLLVESKFPLNPTDFALEFEFTTGNSFRFSAPVSQSQDIFQGNEVKNVLARINSVNGIVDAKGNKTEKIEGTVAFKGPTSSVSGKVFVVVNPSKDKFEKGGILVASSTTPDFMHLIRKASAIITDQIGLATHAALTSRELEIPCIVGTSVASVLLNNGDNVTLNLDDGKVSINNNEQ